MSGNIALIDYKKCRPELCDSGSCAAALACPRKLLKQEAGYEVPMPPDVSVCQGCAKCVVACPAKAIQVRLI